MQSPAPNGQRHTRHSGDDVVTAALRILDEHGLPDLTMRRLAANLGVQPSALYWHFANKQTLLASIADRIVSRTAPQAGSPDWKSSARLEAEALRDALLDYRDGAEVVASTIALGLGAHDAENRLSAAIHRGGFDQPTSAVAAAALLHFILGHVWHEQQRAVAHSLGVATGVSAGGDGRTRDAFDFGITLFLDGLEAAPKAGLDPSTSAEEVVRKTAGVPGMVLK
ncbi:MAG: TetR/AcrR family transcriptional regulator C-terminal domain-containing protein [Burkholderiaceae bacterium]|nr:TetR/AcrR family transcriptional regulator C-terminal domain-containing protein [Microbacteriaceae bacterium]